MITNLFSIFDPSSCISYLPNWLSILFWLVFIPSSYFIAPSRISKIYSNILNEINKEISVISVCKNIHISILLTAIFIFLFFNNILGLLSYNFTASSHISFSLSLALPLWLTYTLYSVFIKTSAKLAHLVPAGTPAYLIPFIVLIETIRLIIRPFTLAIRLAANIIAGHLLISLLSSYAHLRDSRILWVISTRFLLLILETAVAAIQAYVFIILTTLYINEI